MRKFTKTGKHLGTGTQGCVYEAIEVETKKKFAMKYIFLDGNRQIPAAARREINILKIVNNENLMRLVHVVEEGDHPYIIVDLMDSDLGKFIKTNAPLDPSTVKKFLGQILSGLKYFHDLKYMHRDLKPGNVLVKDSQVKISDFGLAREFGSTGTTYSPGIGSITYMAPELLLEDTTYSSPVDIWAAGCIFAEMVTGNALFKTETNTVDDQLKTIFRIVGIPDEASWAGVTSLPNFPSDLKKSRPTGLAREVQGLSYYGLDLLSKMLCMNPARRITANQALKHEYFRLPY